MVAEDAYVGTCGHCLAPLVLNTLTNELVRTRAEEYSFRNDTQSFRLIDRGGVKFGIELDDDAGAIGVALPESLNRILTLARLLRPHSQ
jgi:hypothetical protein